MKDSVTLDRIKLLHPKLIEEANLIYSDICDALNGKAFCRFTSTLRTFAEQDALYAKGRTAPGGIVTKSKGGSSYHNYGLALDIVLVNGTSANYDIKKDFDGDGKSDWAEVVQVFKEYGWEWGGDWKFFDAPHFQKTFGKSIVELQSLHKAKKVDKNGYVLI